MRRTGLARGGQALQHDLAHKDKAAWPSALMFVPSAERGHAQRRCLSFLNQL